MMKIDEFTLYFLARLTKVQRVIDLNNRNNVIIDIPANYKDVRAKNITQHQADIIKNHLVGVVVMQQFIYLSCFVQQLYTHDLTPRT